MMSKILTSLVLICTCPIISCQEKNNLESTTVNYLRIHNPGHGNIKPDGQCIPYSLKCKSNEECCFGFCDKDPTWKSGLCKPPCGRSPLLPKPISNARNAEYSDFPWHAGIYEHNTDTNSYDEICGGTLVSEKVVITAAHCVSEDKLQIKVKNSNNLKVALGNYYKAFSSSEDKLTQIIDVDRIEIGDMSLANNIAVVILKTDVVYNRVVRPVCLDIGMDNFEQDQLKIGAIGMVIGWRYAEGRKIGESLIKIEMLYLPRDECPSDSQPKFLPLNKTGREICTPGYIEGVEVHEDEVVDGSVVCREASGGGLIFEDRKTKSYYLRGVVAVDPEGCREGQITLFTKVSNFKDLIEKYVQNCNKASYLRTCGRSVSQAAVSQVREADVNEFPWHAGIYKYDDSNDSYEHICGGTLISRKVVITAARCPARVTTEHERIGAIDVSKLKVALGKHHKSFGTSEESAQILDVEDVDISKEFIGPMTFQANDLALVMLKREVEYNIAVRPVCLDLGEDNFEWEQLTKDAIGKVALYGTADNDTLNVLETPFVPRESCIDRINFKFVSYVSQDKMCTGDESSKTTVCVGDSGEGLVFKDTETGGYYLRGIISFNRPTNSCEGHEFILLTKISSYTELLEKYALDCQEVCKRKKCEPLKSKKLTIVCYTPDGKSTKCDKPLPLNTKAMFSCKAPNYHNIKKPEYDVIQCKNGQWDRPMVDDFCETECGKSVPKSTHQAVVSQGKQVEYGEFPWQAGIYEYKESNHTYEQICGGTLISQKIVISAAHCVTEASKTRNVTIKPFKLFKVALGKFYRTFNVSNRNVSEEAFVQILGIKNIEVPSDYLGSMSFYDYDIAFLTLERKIEYSEVVGPVCLDIGESDFEEEHLKKGSIGKVVGWGLTKNKTSSETLIMAEMPFVPKSECTQKIHNNLILPANRDNVICAGNKTSSMTVCQGDSGGGLVFEDADTKKYYLRGIVSLGPKGCQGEEYALFTKLSFYKDLVRKYLQLP